MNGRKMFTLTRQHQLYAISSFILFLFHLLEVIFGQFERVRPITTMYGTMLLLSAFILFGGGKIEKEDELSKKNLLKANAFIVSVFLTCMMVALVLLAILGLGETGYLIHIKSNVLIALYWFIFCLRSTAFLVYERLGRD